MNNYKTSKRINNPSEIFCLRNSILKLILIFTHRRKENIVSKVKIMLFKMATLSSSNSMLVLDFQLRKNKLHIHQLCFSFRNFIISKHTRTCTFFYMKLLPSHSMPSMQANFLQSTHCLCQVFAELSAERPSNCQPPRGVAYSMR